MILQLKQTVMKSDHNKKGTYTKLNKKKKEKKAADDPTVAKPPEVNSGCKIVKLFEKSTVTMDIINLWNMEE